MKYSALLPILLLAALSHAQIKHPQASPSATVEQDIGLSKVKIAYSRPSARGRTIFGDLVPYGRIWRVGANESTKFTCSDDLDILGKTLPKGTYALYAFPNETEWQIVFHKNISHWGDGRKAYDAREDAFRVTIKPQLSGDFQENFLISFDSITHNTAVMVWHWANTKINISLSANTDAQMQQEIEFQIKNNPTAQTYYEAARYLEEQGKDHEMALGYLNKAIALGGDTYYFHRVKSLVEAALDDYDSAISSAEKSIELAQEEEKDEFVRMNIKNIKLWKSKLN
jgi:tetratricopeptide (TPR) repeat protein